MGKNVRMLNCFFKVMFNNEKEIGLIIPDMYAPSVYKIDYGFLKENGFYNLIFDIDNTLVPVDDKAVPPELKRLFRKLADDGFKICIMSNNGKERVLPVAEMLEVPYLYESKKPKCEAFDNALEFLSSERANTVMVGDQMMSDIKGAKEYGLYTIMVDPVSDKQNFKTGTSRILQNMMEKHLAKQKLFTPRGYYIKEGK